MATPSGYRRVDLPLDRADEVMHIDQWGFAFSVRPKELRELRTAFNFDRGRGIEIADASRGQVGSLAAVHSSIEHQMRVPGGGAIATSGLTWVAVHQGHRRRGLLRDMIDDHFARSRARGEAISTLYAAETEIYQRFGYGLGCQSYSLSLGRKPSLKDVAGAADLVVRLEDSSVDQHADEILAVQQRMDRPGTMVSFDDATRADIFLDMHADREGAEQRRIAIVEDQHGPAAYALFARKTTWEDFQPGGVNTVTTWGSAHGQATHRLFSVLADLDLMDKTKVQKVATDDPLLHQLVDIRGIKATLVDNLWVRILDVKAALEARTYSEDVTVAFELTDSLIPENSKVWVMAIRDGMASVERGDRGTSPELSLGINELSAAYLGGTTVETLARAGSVFEVKAGSVRALSRAMRGDQAPVCNIGF